jgi:hypothetical protein
MKSAVFLVVIPRILETARRFGETSPLSSEWRSKPSKKSADTFSSTLTMGAIWPSDMPYSLWITRRYNPGDCSLQKCGSFLHYTFLCGSTICRRSQWPRDLRHEPSSPARTLGLWVRIPFKGMDVYVCLFCVCVVLCVGSGLATGWSPVQGVLPTVYRLRNWKSGQGPQGL